MSRRPGPSAAPSAAPGLGEWGLVLAVAGVPLAWSSRVLAAATVPKLAVLALAVLACAAALAFSARGRAFARTPLDAPLAAAALVLLVSAWSSQDRLLSLWGDRVGYPYGLWPMALCAALYYCAAWSEPAAARRILALALAAGFVVGTLGVAQRLGLDPFGSGEVFAGWRSYSTLGGPVFLGSYLALLLPLALRAVREEPGPWSAACLAGVVLGLLSSVSVAAWLGALCGAGCFLALTGRLRRPAWTPARWVLGAACAAALAGAAAWLLSQRHWSPSVMSRLEIWSAAWRAFRENPWLGMGPDTFELASRRLRTDAYFRWISTANFSAHPHNEVLQVLVTTGLAGAAAACWVVWALVRSAREAVASPERPWAPALAAGLAGYALNLQFNPGSLAGFAVAAVFAGLLCGGRPGSAAPRRWAGVLVLALALLSAGKAARLCWAEASFRDAKGLEAAGDARGALSRYAAALAAEPCELEFQRHLVNLLFAGARAQKDDARRAGWVREAAAVGKRSLDCHPRHFMAHYLRGFTALQEASVTKDRASLAEAGLRLDEALRLNPGFPPLLELRQRVAELSGDAPLAASLARRRQELAALSGARVAAP